MKRVISFGIGLAIVLALGDFAAVEAGEKKEKKIRWAPSMKAALADAKDRNVPIMVVFLKSTTGG